MKPELRAAYEHVLQNFLVRLLEGPSQGYLPSFVRRVRVDESPDGAEIYLDGQPWAGLVLEAGVLMAYDRTAGREVDES